MRCGNLFVISGPSGAGKGTLVARLLHDVPDAWLSVSATTRAPREGEVDGVHYYFVSRERFEEMAQAGDLLEWAEYAGNCYGTPLSSVLEQMKAGGIQEDLLKRLMAQAFITTANYRSNIPAPLQDRMEIIEVSSYTEVEKLNIAKKHLVPKQLREHGIDKRVFGLCPGTIIKIG